MLAVLAAAGCSRSGGGSYVAKVGSSTLTRADLERLRAAAQDSTPDAQRLVNEWVMAELLYREAERRGLSESDEVAERTRQAHRRLAVAALLEQEIYADTGAVTEEAIRDFYERNAAAFTLREEVVNLSYVAFSDRDAANAFRGRVLGGRPWASVLESLGADSSGRGGLLEVADHQYFTRSRLYPPELWKLALTLPRGDVSFVLKSGAVFYVLCVHGVQRQGAVPDLAFVHNDVRDRLLIRQRRMKYERLLDDLRLKTGVEVRLENAGKDRE